MAKKSKRRETMKMSKSKRKAIGRAVNSTGYAGNIIGWDRKLTVQQNFQNLGIAISANEAVSKSNKPAQPGLLTEKLTELQKQPLKTRGPIKSMDIQEQYMLQDLVKAHGDNYEAMRRDKLNKYFLTAEKLRSRIEIMNAILAREDPSKTEEIKENISGKLHPVEVRQKENGVILQKTDYVKEVEVPISSKHKFNNKYSIREPKLVQISYAELNAKYESRKNEGTFRK